MARLQDKVALITGASRGIGRAIAMRLAHEGAAVAISYCSNEAAAQETVREIECAGGRCCSFQADVSIAQEAADLVSSAMQKLGGIHVLVNNAGVSADALTMRMSEEDWDRVLDTDLKGAFLTTKAVLRAMLRQRWGRIINISSVVGYTGNVGQANYAAAKAGLIGLTKSVAREVATRGITVNAVAPGLIETAMTDALSDELRTWMVNQIPLGHAGTPADVAGAVAYLASDDGAYITGQVLRVDGGLVMV